MFFLVNTKLKKASLLKIKMLGLRRYLEPC